MELAYDAFAQTPVVADPFAHVVVRNFIPPSLLQGVVADLPDLAKGGSFPLAAVPLGPRARALAAELEGPRFRQAVVEKFNLDLDGAPTMITLRGRSREKDGRIHCDSASKRVTVLLYLNPQTEAWTRQEGCLRLLRGPEDLDDYAVEVPPVDGTLLVFPNGPGTWHGHRPFVGRRYVVQLNYMTGDNAARSEIRRHRLSALVKRIGLALATPAPAPGR